MSITQKIEKYHKIETIKKMKNGIEKDMTIGSLIADLGNKSINAVSKYLGCCWKKGKSCFETYNKGYIQMKLEFRGRKKITEKYPKLKKRYGISNRTV